MTVRVGSWPFWSVRIGSGRFWSVRVGSGRFWSVLVGFGKFIVSGAVQIFETKCFSKSSPTYFDLIVSFLVFLIRWRVCDMSDDDTDEFGTDCERVETGGGQAADAGRDEDDDSSFGPDGGERPPRRELKRSLSGSQLKAARRAKSRAGNVTLDPSINTGTPFLQPPTFHREAGKLRRFKGNRRQQLWPDGPQTGEELIPAGRDFGAVHGTE